MEKKKKITVLCKGDGGVLTCIKQELSTLSGITGAETNTPIHSGEASHSRPS